jgi:glycosyltransferase involved in cell wall biosynthesis
MLDLTIAIPVKNAAAYIGECLEAIPERFANRIVVIDSGSTDGTVQIATDFGAEVLQFQWDGRFPKERNWFLRNHSPSTGWVLFLDADEVLTPAFVMEIESRLPCSDQAGYWLNYTIHFLGFPLRRGYPLKKLALFRVGAGEYERIEEDHWSALDMEVHEHPVLNGAIGEIRARIEHRESIDIYSFVAKHNEYSSWEASRLHRAERETAWQERWTWKQRLKFLIVRIPLCGPLYFLGSYLLMGGFLDGSRGFLFALLKGAYFTEVHCKLRELTRKSGRLP